MKKYIVLLFLIILFGFTFAFRRPLYNLYRTYFVKENKDVTLKESNDYTRDYDFNFVKRTDDFTPNKYQDLLNIYYTVLNSGVEEFSFYCPDEYSSCIDDVDSLANNQKVLSTINNFVHPFNSFRHLETSYDDYGKITLKIEHIYSNSDIKLIEAKVKEVESEIWNNSMSNEDKIKEAHNHIINNSKYDKDRSDNNIVRYKSDTAYGTLLEGYSLCGGYTDAMELFLEDMGVKSYKISSENHVWNAVNLDNAWYHLDLTWDDPITTDGSDILEYNFFLITTSELNELENEQHNYDKNVYSELAT
ncbi:MAG TPA: hypothetical protein IAB38_01920 [Candidatus Onthousia excrementipullorum]|uniref:Transglutaminase-like domain-containing protein n=1 Tax=Candidatus Onthousia excrementipullorum TaxID=2840884 RepID=A0A9D1DTE8_9FIRM|nr:hypothetical protein [Candidatus Onthousia excrementipullorum]